MKKQLLLGLTIILIANGFVLAGAWYNRTAEPNQSIELTERELYLPSWRALREDSSVTLQLNWQTAANDHSGYYGSRTLLVDAETLAALDIQPADYQANYQNYDLFSRQVLVVLELDGAAYQQHLEHIKALEQKQPPQTGIESRYDKANTAESRLFAIDAGVDYQALKRRYPADNIIIVPARARIDYYRCLNLKNNTTKDASRTCPEGLFPIGISSLDVDNIMLTSTQAQKLMALKTRQYKDPFVSRYSAKVTWGGLYRPWIADIWLTPNQAAPIGESN